MPKASNLTGEIFGRLTVVRDNGRSCGKIKWLCYCACGGFASATTGALRWGSVASCGCLRREVTGRKSRTHGKSGTPTHQTWKGMKQRCGNQNEDSFKNYGARGIVVCKRWDSFENFLNDMKEKPPGMTIERIDNDGPYSPKNCRWATPHDQSRNTRRNTHLTVGDKTMILVEWSELTGIKVNTILARLRLGYSVKEALTTPVKSGRDA